MMLPPKFDRQFLVFIFIGVFNTIFGYGLYWVFLQLGLHYSLAVLMSTVMGVLFNFKTIGRFVFQSNNNVLIVRFSCVYAFLYFLNILSIQLIHSYGMNYEISGALMLVPMAILSFILNKNLVFRL